MAIKFTERRIRYREMLVGADWLNASIFSNWQQPQSERATLRHTKPEYLKPDSIALLPLQNSQAIANVSLWGSNLCTVSSLISQKLGHNTRGQRSITIQLSHPQTSENPPKTTPSLILIPAILSWSPATVKKNQWNQINNWQMSYWHRFSLSILKNSRLHCNNKVTIARNNSSCSNHHNSRSKLSAVKRLCYLPAPLLRRSLICRTLTPMLNRTWTSYCGSHKQ